MPQKSYHAQVGLPQDGNCRTGRRQPRCSLARQGWARRRAKNETRRGSTRTRAHKASRLKCVIHNRLRRSRVLASQQDDVVGENHHAQTEPIQSQLPEDEGGREYMRAVRHYQIGHCLKGMLLLVDSAPESYLHLPNKALLRPHCLDLSKSIRIPAVAFSFLFFCFYSPPPNPEAGGTTFSVASVFPP